MNQQQRGGQGRRNRNRGGQGGNALSIPGVPQDVQNTGWKALTPQEVGALLRSRLEGENQRLQDKHQADLAKTAAETDRINAETEAKRAVDTTNAQKTRLDAESAARASR